MTNVIAFPDREGILERAAMWFSLMDERSLNEEERKEFRQWIQASDEHVRAFREIASLWGRMDRLQYLAEIFPLEESATTVAGSAMPSKRSRGVAAALLVVVAATALSIYQFSSTPGNEVMDYAAATAVGQTETVNLIDGSMVTANTDTQLSISLTSVDRRVVLDKGEAYFEVAHDANRPFVVDIGEATVRAIGTAFSVYRKNGSFEVVVAEGSVEVSYKPAQNLTQGSLPDFPGAASTREAPSAAIVQAGEMVEYLHSDSSIPVTARVATLDSSGLARRLSWRQGMLAFEGDTLETVIETFDRYTDIEIEFASAELRDLKVGGYFSSTDVEGMLSALHRNFGIQVDRLSDDHVRLSASAN